MDPSHSFPPSPREMYMYRPGQHVNGHKVQSPSPTRGRPPPILPERKPETQLGNRTSRTSVTSRDSASSDVASPPQSPGYAGQGHHGLQHHHVTQHGHTYYPDSKPFAYAAGFSPEKTATVHSLTNTNISGKFERDASPQRLGAVRSEGHVGSGIFQRNVQNDLSISQLQDTDVVYQRIERNRLASSPDSLMAGGQGYYQGGAFHGSDSLRHSEGIYGQFIEPSNGSPHRPSLTYVPPPVVPTLQTDQGRIDKAIPKDQAHHMQQLHQHKVVNNLASPGMPHDSASHNHHHHCNHHQHPHHHHHPQQPHDNSQVLSTHPTMHPSASSASPKSTPMHVSSNNRIKPKHDSIPPPPSIPVPPTPAPNQDRYVSAMSPTRSMSHALPLPASETAASPRSRSSTKRTEPKPLSPLLVSNAYCTNTTPQIQQVSSPGPNLHHHHPHVDPQTVDHLQNNHHQVKASPVQVPPPPPPLRTSSTSQLPINHHADLNPVPTGVRSPRSGSPARQPGAVQHHIHRQPSLATMDDLAQVKLRTVSDSNPNSPLLSPVTAGEVTSGGLNVRLRPTPGKFRNIYAEDETTLPPPPPLDDLDELPPPPPPPELLCPDLCSLAFDSGTHSKVAPATHVQPGEGNSSHVDHRSQQHSSRQRQPPNSSNKPQNQDTGSTSGDKSGVCGSILAREELSGLEQLISETVSNMDFEIPDDIDLSKCPGLVEINQSTPNWKRDMVEKKNQEKIEEYVKKILKEREQEAKWKNVPEWKRKILQKKDEEDAGAASPTPDPKTPVGKKPAKKAPVPPPKEAKDDFSPPKPKSDIVPAALQIDPEELAAMPPWKRELLFKRDKVPVTFSNEFNPDEEEDSDNKNVSGS